MIALHMYRHMAILLHGDVQRQFLSTRNCCDPPEASEWRPANRFCSMVCGRSRTPCRGERKSFVHPRALLPRHYFLPKGKKCNLCVRYDLLPMSGVAQENDGAGDGTRTRDLLLGKQILYQLSYSRIGFS